MAKKRAKKAKKAKKAKRSSRKKGLNLRALKRGAQSRIKKLQANIKKRNKDIKRARKRGDAETVKVHKDAPKRARGMIQGLRGVVKAMATENCPFMSQGDPTVS